MDHISLNSRYRITSLYEDNYTALIYHRRVSDVMDYCRVSFINTTDCYWRRADTSEANPDYLNVCGMCVLCQVCWGWWPT